MRRSYLVLVVNVLILFAATLATPTTAAAQPGDRPATQLFFGPTGRALPKGEGYVKAIGLVVPYAQGGLTDRLSIGIGMPIFAPAQVIVLTPKFQVQRSARHATSIGALHLLAFGESVGIAYAAHTVEGKTDALHIAVLTPYDKRTVGRRLGVMLGAEHTINRRTTFITENYLLGPLPMVSAGIRTQAPHTTWDLGWVVPISRFATAGGPVLNVGWKF